jgi:hypothetical protein
VIAEPSKLPWKQSTSFYIEGGIVLDKFPHTTVGGVSVPRLIAGSNWFLGYSHTSLARDKFIRHHQTRVRIAQILAVFLENDIDAVMGPPSDLLEYATLEAEQKCGKKFTRIITPMFNVLPGGDPETEPEKMLDYCQKLGATFCMPHQCVTDALIDRTIGRIRDLDRYTHMIRQRGMLPGLSTHMPEGVIYADRHNEDVETYIQIYNAAGFLMQVEADWVMHVIHQAKKPVMTIKPLAAGRLLPVVGLSFVWSTIRAQDMVVIGTTTPDEVREVVDISLDLLHKQPPEYELQRTRSKRLLETYIP